MQKFITKRKVIALIIILLLLLTIWPYRYFITYKALNVVNQSFLNLFLYDEFFGLYIDTSIIDPLTMRYKIERPGTAGDFAISKITDKDTLIILDRGDCGSVIIDNVDPEKVVFYNHRIFIHNNKVLVDDCYKVNETTIDAATMELIRESYIKDKNHIYSPHGIPIPQADRETFRVRSYEEKEVYYKEAEHMPSDEYYQLYLKIPDAEDKNYYYKDEKIVGEK